MKNYHYLCTQIVESGSEDSERDMESLIDIRRPVTVCRASAGTGKTYTLAAYYVGLLLSGLPLDSCYHLYEQGDGGDERAHHRLSA